MSFTPKKDRRTYLAYMTKKEAMFEGRLGRMLDLAVDSKA